MTIDKAKLKQLLSAQVSLHKVAKETGTIEDENVYLNADDALNEYLDDRGIYIEDVALALLAEIERLATSRSKKERELEQELEVWRHGPFCWSCGDTGDVHDITGEWRGECDCLAAQLINANRARDQLKAENEALRNALGDLLALYEDDEGCRNLPEYIAGRAAMAKEAGNV